MMVNRIRANKSYFMFSFLFSVATFAWATGFQSLPNLSLSQNNISIIGGIASSILLMVQFFFFSKPPPYQVTHYKSDMDNGIGGFQISISHRKHLQGKAPIVTTYESNGQECQCMVSIDITGDVNISGKPNDDDIIVRIG